MSDEDIGKPWAFVVPDESTQNDSRARPQHGGQLVLGLRGRLIVFKAQEDPLNTLMVVALLNLYDPRIETVFRQAGLVLKDISGQQVWP